MSHEFEDSLDCAVGLDAADPLASFREQFHLPRLPDGREEVYLLGNSLGLQPTRTGEYVNEELRKWSGIAVRGHFESDFPWMPYQEFLAGPMGELVGAKSSEVVMMNSLTVNLHLMMVSFYRPTAERYRILVESHTFPSDHYAVESQIRFHGYDPARALIHATPREGEETLRTGDLVQLIDREGHGIALILLPGVQYYTGQRFDMFTIARAGREKGCVVGFDLAHAAGNVPMSLHDWDVDFACWCSYKYLNSGPGSIGGCFVHERHARSTHLPRFAGWWGHDKATRFLMGPHFVPTDGADGWQVSNPPILSMAAVRASLDVFREAGGMTPLREKSVRLTGYLEFLLRRIEGVEIITPADPEARGSQLSMRIDSRRRTGREVFQSLERAGVTCDWREPDVIRAAPAPLYNRFVDAYRFARILQEIMGG